MKQKNYIIKLNLPETLSLIKSQDKVIFSGPLGSTGVNLKKIDPLGLSAIFINNDENSVSILTQSKSSQGLIKKIFANKIQGITRGFLIYLKIIGIGYRASLQKNTLSLKLGYSHDLLYNVPNSVKVFLIDPTLICLFGIDKNQITQIASNLRSLRKPSAYKGKGIRILNEKIHLKTGKRK